MKLLLVFLVFFLCSYSSNAQLLDEGSTTTTEIEIQGGVEEVTETTTTIEHKNTGDVLDGDTGVVTNKYEGDADVDWGGAGAIYSHSSCSDAASGFPATGTDGRTSACGHARTNSLTTWRQYVDLNSFGIEDGGEVNYEFLFAFPNSMYNSSSQTAYVQTKGYNDNVLQWETGLVAIDKTTFTQNPNNYNNNTNWVNTVTSSYDFVNQLDKVYIEIGGYGEYYWDEFQYNVVYNHITTSVETWMQIVQQQENITTTLDIMNTYDPISTFDDTNSTPVEEVQELIEIIEMPALPELTMEISEPMIQVMQMEEALTVETTFEDTTVTFEPVITMEAVTEEIQEVLVEIEVIVENDTIEPPTKATTEPIEEVKDSKPTPETASNEEIVEEVKEEPKEIAQEEVKEEIKEDVKEEPKPEPKEVVKEDPKKEEVKEVKVEDKPTKKQEAKQEKAKEIMAEFESQYDAVAQLTTLALVNALGADIKTYSQIEIQVQPVWYVSKEIYEESMLQDPLGNYFGVRDSLVFEQMIGSQYNE